ncbi:cAMP-dependent protein kinase regulatory subunit [Tritrichomonas foetus]|uniref:cAMP-dependent protein kinase regulatory subunit n=1 Tax=Tritrichomonas foetus TaxID=1144522 RepID=A0A1J4JPD3_9EUKA|nr:cAMP-dependent protein kinase regulatory subunit [Tritrichomonas foetus]|eukprot:OHS99381.1 cAMP-dependent protein kinase regulatory subunit [Tritrichomonas foetus]
MSQTRQTAEQYLEEKHIKQLLQRIVVSLLEARPENPETHIVSLLSSNPRSNESTEKWPTLNGKPTDSIAFSSIGGGALATGRRQSAINPSVLSNGSLSRRKAMSSKMTSSTTVEIRVVPKDEATFQQLEESVKKVDLFSFLQDEQRRTLVNAMFPCEYNDNDIIIKQGDQPDNFYILKSGKCRVLKRTGDREAQVAVLTPGHYFGELALISGSTRSATVVADGHVDCWAIDQTTYLGLLKEQHNKKRQQYRALLKNVPFLKVLQDYEILLVADALCPVNPSKGEEVVKQGDDGDEFYIILQGECIVSKAENGGEPKEVGRLRSGDYFGELALMQNTPRAATVSAGDNCKLVKLDRASFHRLLGPCSEIFTQNMRLYQSTK